MSGAATDHRTLPRRRGPVLRAAVLQAALDELTDVGYAALTIDRVAERARTGKATVYRYWPSKLELALDAVRSALPDPASDPASLPDTGSLRGDLLALLRATARLLAGPAGEALRGLLSDALREPGRVWEIRQHHRGTGRRATEEVIARAVARGEVDPALVTPRRLEAGEALLRHHFLFDRPPITDEVVVGIVDEVLLPLFRGVVARPPG
ncbi:TetR family transcriptional regulator [Geodermatophilus sp. TF02-6]|uniref:TetR/AcrR family transcriptional regulator n=1 Tax=Geodermatophilus sp. TF02-6 TaxID=2250575 RepID=UPI000DE8CCA2|nr:TetR/AcrR family transcriptional regulator [Geodermatophilus sp. TF02-6]RBY83802.1 TetR family transcriptional regulator [Geodermatophilus sp. TF02-6]